MSSYEVPEPILNTPFDDPGEYWYIEQGKQAERRKGRRASVVFPPRDQSQPWEPVPGILARSTEYKSGFELVMVNMVRQRVKAWRSRGYPGVTRTTLELLQYWQRDGRQRRLFFAQREAVETVIFLTEARRDFLQGIQVPRDEPSDDRKAAGFAGFLRYACKMATGSGKTTVMAMLAAWSILNKINDSSDGRFSDVVLVVCPNVTIRNRLRELDPEEGEASVYRTRDIVPAGQIMADLSQGKVIVTNWHVFEPHSMQTGGVSAKVVKAGIRVPTKETIHIGPKNQTARGKRYLTLETLELQKADGSIRIIEGSEERDETGNLKKVSVESERYVESDTALVARILDGKAKGKQNILVMNDEAHHAYRIASDYPENWEEMDEDEQERWLADRDEATVWVEGLDRINKLRGLNFCVDLSATPYFLGRVGWEANKPFPWIVSDFGLIDAIEAGLVKIPQLAVRDSTGAEVPGYFNIWEWIMDKLTPAEKGGRRTAVKPEAVLKYADHPIRMLAGLWEETTRQWAESKDDPRPPVFILVCKNTRLAKVIYEWLAEDNPPTGLSSARIKLFRNTPERINTIRVDSKVVTETDSENAKSDENRWMRFTLDTVGKIAWPMDRQGRPQYPEGFEDLAKKLEKPLNPPGRDVRCIVSVGMLTEGWDCSTVTHIVGLRPFMSQLLCEQVVGRGLRRRSYDDFTPDGKLPEEVAKIFGVPFDVVPFKANPAGPTPKPDQRKHVYAVPEKAQYEIQFPRVEGYTQAIRNRIAVDWTNPESVPSLVLDPTHIPPEVQVKGLSVTNEGRLSLNGPGKIDDVTLAEFRAKRRIGELNFDLARSLTRTYLSGGQCMVPAQVLFPQVLAIVQRYVAEKVTVRPPADLKDAFLSPYYGWLVERLSSAIRPDTAQGEAHELPRYEANRPAGSTADVDFWTSKPVREVVRSHLNYIVADTKVWEQSATYFIDTDPATVAFVKNAGLGFAIPYLDNGQQHEYLPDFIVRLKPSLDAPRYLILETKGFDPKEEVKTSAARRWVAAVNTDGRHGVWDYKIARRPEDVRKILNSFVD